PDDVQAPRSSTAPPIRPKSASTAICARSRAGIIMTFPRFPHTRPLAVIQGNEQTTSIVRRTPAMASRVLHFTLAADRSGARSDERDHAMYVTLRDRPGGSTTSRPRVRQRVAGTVVLLGLVSM